MFLKPSAPESFTKETTGVVPERWKVNHLAKWLLLSSSCDSPLYLWTILLSPRICLIFVAMLQAELELTKVKSRTYSLSSWLAPWWSAVSVIVWVPFIEFASKMHHGRGSVHGTAWENCWQPNHRYWRVCINIWMVSMCCHLHAHKNRVSLGCSGCFSFSLLNFMRGHSSAMLIHE